MASRWNYFILGLALIQGIFAASPIPVDDEEWESFNEMLRNTAFRLPATARPRHYEVNLTPYFENATEATPFTFDGQVNIYLSPDPELLDPVSEIVLHCNDLTIESLNVSYTVNGVTNQIAAANQVFECLMPFSFLRVITTEELIPGQEYVLSATFTGNLQTNMRGFYRSWYYDSSGTKRWMGTTQFQPGHARQAFPCFDEPGFKATFDITINREPDFSPTISNMPIRENVTLANGRIAETFYTSPYTSTYLLAFIVSHYEMIESNNDTNRPFHIYARDNVGANGEWALEMGELLLEAMEAYTDFPYYSMAENLDMKQAAIPDFSAGAMENWGLLTYREALILFDPLNSNNFYRQRVANIVAHEIAHMWLGNLVTCAWWDNLWLNEGFARFYQYYLTGSVRPDLGYDTRFIVEQVHVSLLADSIDSAHALTNPNVNDPTTVSNHFSQITYGRGAAVIRMTQFLLGVDTFVKGLRAYIRERAFNVAEPRHLFTAFDEAAVEDNALTAYNGITIDEYFKTWSEKAGHPLLTVTVDQRTGQMILTQSRWERISGTSNIPGLWHIPITWTRGGQPDFDDLKPSQIITAQSTVLNRGTTGLEWVIFNKQQSGFYRINYDPTNWALITLALRGSDRTVIHEHNRAQIVDDLFAFARAGIVPYHRALNVLSFLEFEDQYAPWLAAISGFNWVVRRLAHDDDNVEKLREQIINLSVAATTRLGYADITNEPFMDGLLRMYLMSFLCNNGHPQCLAAANTNFQSWRNGGFVPANMRPWVYCSGLRQGSAEDFNYYWNRYLAEDLASEKVVMLEAAGCTNDQASLNAYLDSIVSGGDDVRPQDFNTALNSAVSGNEVNTMRVFEWLRNNVNQTTETLGSIATPLSYITARLLNENQIQEVQTWLDENREVIGDSAYNTGVAGISATRSNLDWSSQRTVELAQYFESGYVEDIIEDITDPTTPEPEAETEGIPELTTPPTTPEPDSANIVALSFVTLIVTLAISFNA